ncbi:hypothetical protein X975_08028, partial [Stegodyphus mimosarum]
MKDNQKEYDSISQNSRLTGRNSGNSEWRPVDKYGFKLDDKDVNLNTRSQEVYRIIEQNSGTKSNSFYPPGLTVQQDRQPSRNQYSPPTQENQPTDFRQHISSQSSRHSGGNLVNEGLRNPSSLYTAVISDENNAEIRKRPDSFFRGNINYNEDNSRLYPSVRNQNYQQNLTTVGLRSQPNTAANIRYEEVSPNTAQLPNEAISYTYSSIQSPNGKAHINTRQSASTRIPETYNHESPKHAIKKNFEENRTNFDGSEVLNIGNQNFRKLSGTHGTLTNRHTQNSKYQTVKETTAPDVNYPINKNFPRQEKKQVNNNEKSTVSNYSPLQHQNFNQGASTFHSQDKLYSSYSASVQQSKPTDYRHEQSITYNLSDGPVNTKLQQTDLYVTTGNKQYPGIHYTSVEPSLSSNQNFRESPRNTQVYVSSKNIYEDQKRGNENFQANVNPQGDHTDLKFQIPDQKKQLFSQSRDQVTFPRNNPVWDDQERLQLEGNRKNVGNKMEPQYRTYQTQEKIAEQLSLTRPGHQNVNLGQNNQKQETSSENVLSYDEKPTNSQSSVHSAHIHQSRNFLANREFDGDKQYSSEGKRQNFVSYERSSAIPSGQNPVNQYNNENSGTTRNYNIDQNQNSNFNYRSQSQQSFNENYKPAIDLPTHISDESSYKSSSSNFNVPFENTQNVNYRLSGAQNGFINKNQGESFKESTARQNLQSKNQASNYKSNYSLQEQTQQENAYKSSPATSTVKNTLNAASSRNQGKQEKNFGSSYEYRPSRNIDSSLTSDNSDTSDKRVAVKEVSRDEIQEKSSAPEALLLVLVSAKRSALEDFSNEPDGADLNEGYESSPEELVDFLSEGSNAKMILDSFHEATNGAYRQLEDE